MNEPASTIRYVSDLAARLLTTARSCAGLTQSELAHLAGTSQSAVAAYEGGRREPSLAVLERLVRASGHVLTAAAERDSSVFSLVDVAQQIRGTKDDQRHLRLVFEFLRSAAEDGKALLLLVAAEPALTGDVRLDALLAAVAEDLCVVEGILPPSWTARPERFLDGFWWVSDLPSARARALVHTPAAYRRRGVMIDRHDLRAA